MAKKAKKVSWRTLTRRAAKAAGDNLPKARRLRAEAAKLRRADRKKVKKAAPTARRNIAGATRAAKGWATRRTNAISKARGEGGLLELLSKVTRAPQDPPGRGEIVGGVFSHLADRLAKLARKKGGTDAIQNELSALAEASKYEGCVETDKAATMRLIGVQGRMAERVVCGFIAEVAAYTAQYHGLPTSMTLNLSSFLITKIVDALNKAGYTAAGMRNTDEAQTIRREEGR